MSALHQRALLDVTKHPTSESGMTRKVAMVILGLSAALSGALAVTFLVIWLADSTPRGSVPELVGGVALIVGAVLSLRARRQLQLRATSESASQESAI
jgi:hypothetical protein